MLTMLVSAPSAWSGYSGRALCNANYNGNLTAGTENNNENGVRPVASKNRPWVMLNYRGVRSVCLGW